MKVTGAHVKFDTGEQRLLSPSTLTNPVIGEITKAWESVRASQLWKEIFIEVTMNGQSAPVLYLRDEMEMEEKISCCLELIFNGKKKPFEPFDKSLCGIEFDETQTIALNLIHKHPIVLIDGGPGSGKTTILREIQLRGDAAQLRVQGATFLGKAAARIRAHAKMPADTIHRISRKGKRRATPTWRDLRDNPVREPDIIVIDEAAMCSNEVFLMALNCCKPNMRLVVIGDSDQLEPIGAGAPFLQLIKSKLFPIIKLTGQHRSGCGIVEACQAINRGEFPANNKEFQFAEREDEKKFEYLERALKGKDDHETQIVTTSNNERHAVNEWYRGRKNYAVDQVYKNERVCGNVNDYETGMRNGEIGVIIGEKKSKDARGTLCRYFQTQSPNNPQLPYYSWPRPYSKKEKRRHGPHGKLDWAYCLTGNKCQGSEWDHMIVHLTEKWLRGRPWATRKWLYTAVSWGRKSVAIFGNRALIYDILANGADCFRITMLEKLLAKVFECSSVD
jgi:exodeoxyribonuclease V alpha subunit